MEDVLEDKIIFEVDGEIRILRGKITKEDEHFIFLERRDGNHRINKDSIIKIEEGNNEQTY